MNVKDLKLGPKDHFYSASLVKVIDGDTLTASINFYEGMGIEVVGQPYAKYDLGFGVYCSSPIFHVRFRLRFINAFELREPGGKEAKDYLKETLTNNFLLHSHRIDRYGRYLATIWTLDKEELTWENSVNKTMVDLGLAVTTTYEKGYEI